jgi:hypothetical protein
VAVSAGYVRAATLTGGVAPFFTASLNTYPKIFADKKIPTQQLRQMLRLKNAENNKRPRCRGRLWKTVGSMAS